MTCFEATPWLRRRSPFGLTVNLVTLASVAGLMYTLDQLSRRRAFSLRTLLGLMLAAGVACGCWSVARSHDAWFLRTCHALLDEAGPEH